MNQDYDDKNKERDFEKLLHQAVELETDEKRLFNSVQTQISERSTAQSFSSMIASFDSKLIMASCSLAIVGAFFVGSLVPLPMTDPETEMALGIALGSELSVGVLAGIDLI